MSAHASQAFSIVHCTDSEDLPRQFLSDVTSLILELIFRKWQFTRLRQWHSNKQCSPVLCKLIAQCTKVDWTAGRYTIYYYYCCYKR